MDTIELLQIFADPEVMQALPLSDRLFASLITTLLGMGITFISLIVLQIVIQLTARLAAPKPKKKLSAEIEETRPEIHSNKDLLQEEELVAAIATALAVQLKTSVSNIVIRNIEKVGEPSSSWHKAGLAEHMNNSL